jgi:hypothetical protein
MYIRGKTCPAVLNSSCLDVFQVLVNGKYGYALPRLEYLKQAGNLPRLHPRKIPAKVWQRCTVQEGWVRCSGSVGKSQACWVNILNGHSRRPTGMPLLKDLGASFPATG